MKYGFAMPPDTGPLDPELLRQDAVMELAACAEENGFAAVSVTDHPIPSEDWRTTGHDTLDPFVALSFAAAATRTLMLMTHVVVVPYRNPFLLAKSVASLDALSGGRMLLGVGVGYQQPEFDALGVDYAERNVLFDEALAAMKLAWSGRPVELDGTRFSAHGVTAQPVPAQHPHPPLWFGGNSALTMRRIVEHGHGWLILPVTPERARRRGARPFGISDVPDRFEQLRRMAAEAGRTNPIEAHYPVYESNGIAPLQVRNAVRELADAGVGWCSWHARSSTVKGQKDEIRRFADEIIGGG